MKKLLTFIALFLLSVAPTVAQISVTKQAILPNDTPSLRETKSFPIHITDKLLEAPEGKEALRNFHTLREKGLLPAYKNQSMPVKGDTLAFRVLNIEKNVLETLKFRLEFVHPKAYLWVSLTELGDKNYSDAEFTELTKALFESTPLDPQKGIIDSDIAVFGNPPNSDGDGRIDILWYNIIDGYNGTTNLGWIEGFFSPNDLVGGGSGNNKDILHIDTFPTMKLGVSEVAQVTGHELQHLIHANYDIGEDLFVNEGLSEWAEIHLGYRGRTINYLNTESNSTFVQFRAKTDDVYKDYQRGGLFSTYLADQYGAANMGSITQSKKRAFVGYEEFIAKYAPEATVADVMLNFHTANYLNSTATNKLYGYSASQRKSLKATPYLSVDGALATTTAETTLPKMQAGGMYYLRWRGVKDFVFNVDAVTNGINTLSELRGMVKIRAITIDKAGATKIADYAPSTAKITLTGDFSEVTLIVAHIQPNNAKALLPDVKYSANWKNDFANTNIVAETVEYKTAEEVISDDTGSWFFNIGTATAKQVTRFIKPKNAVRLHKFSIANYYSNQFADSNLDTTAPRDFRLTVWKNNTTRTLPGTEIFGVDLKDNRGFSGATLKVTYQEIDLSPYADKLSALPDTVYIGIAETGTDQNYMVIAPLSYEVENVSFLFGSTRWLPLWDIEFQGGFKLPKGALGMKAQFLVQKIVANEDITELPKQITLSQNYPNPFNPETTIQYTLPQASAVKLTIYDILGRQVESLVSQNQVAGEYSILWDAKNYASGTYFYTLEVGNARLTKKLTLMK